MKWYHITYLRREYVLPSLCVYHSKNYPKWARLIARAQENVHSIYVSMCAILILRMNSFHSLFVQWRIQPVIMKCTIFSYIWCLPMLICWFLSQNRHFRIKSQFLMEWTEQINFMDFFYIQLKFQLSLLFNKQNRMHSTKRHLNVYDSCKQKSKHWWQISIQKSCF